MTREALERLMAKKPAGLVRFKGFVSNAEDGAWEVQCVGPSVGIKALREDRQTQVVGIGLKGRVTLEEIDTWWRG